MSSSSAQTATAKLRRVFKQLPVLARGLRLAWSAAGKWTVLWLILLLVQGTLPVVGIYLTKFLIEALLSLDRSAPWPAVRQVIFLAVAFAAVAVAIEAVRSALVWIRTVQAELLQDHISALIHEKSVAADLAFYEFPDFYDHLYRARSEAAYRPAALLDNLGSLIQHTVTLFAMGAVLIPLGPGLALALVISTLPAFWVVLRYSVDRYQWQMSATGDERRTWYYDWLLTSPETAAELRLFDLGGRFQNSFNGLRQKLRTARLTVARRYAIAELLAGAFGLLVVCISMAWVLWRVIHGAMQLGDLLVIYIALSQGQRLMRSLLESIGQLYSNSLFLGNLFEFLALEPLVPEPEQDQRLSVTSLNQHIRFRNVSFTYPQGSHQAIADFSLTIPAGQIVALVGANGAGKSTLIKLLCRFYDPDSGGIELDGIDIRHFTTRDLRRLISVLFQQPIHYNATVRENVEYGDLEYRRGLDEIEQAARAAGATEIIARLPNDYDSILGKWFTGGTELSVGEWQRIALARAFFRRAPIIVLDEPTSALDPWAEADWLRRFRQLASGHTAIIITHRFTTAMYADVIHVMENGQIVESGTHNELLYQNGRYAESWTKQMSVAEVASPRPA